MARPSMVPFSTGIFESTKSCLTRHLQSGTILVSVQKLLHSTACEPRSSSGLGRRHVKAEITSSTLVRGTIFWRSLACPFIFGVPGFSTIIGNGSLESSYLVREAAHDQRRRCS